MNAGFAPMNATSQKYLTHYQALRDEARSVDQKDCDANKNEGYVNVFDKTELSDKQGVKHSKLRQMNSYPITESKTKSDDPLISRTTIHKKVGIVESTSDHVSREKDGTTLRDGFTHRVEFVDDGRRLQVKDSNIFMGGEFFLSETTQNFIIDKKTGDIKTLPTTASSI